MQLQGIIRLFHKTLIRSDFPFRVRIIFFFPEKRYVAIILSIVPQLRYDYKFTDSSDGSLDMHLCI